MLFLSCIFYYKHSSLSVPSLSISCKIWIPTFYYFPWVNADMTEIQAVWFVDWISTFSHSDGYHGGNWWLIFPPPPPTPRSIKINICYVFFIHAIFLLFDFVDCTNPHLNHFFYLLTATVEQFDHQDLLMYLNQQTIE